MRYPLLGGSYRARSLIANAIRCVNYYPEMNREDAPVPFTYYQRPGLRQKSQGPVAPVRMLYQASNGAGYAVIGNTVQLVNADWSLTQLGTIESNEPTPCRAIDNGLDLLLVDGSAVGYQINLISNALSVVSDSTGTFQGANTVATLDTYVLWNMPGTINFGSTLSGELVFDALYFAGKVGYPDLLKAVVVNRHEILLLGSLKSEIWYNAGNQNFPFAILPGAYIEHGIAATYSAASSDIETFWLGRDLQGSSGVVFALRGYDVRRISNHALEYAIQQIPDISDAIGWTFQLGGHYFYVLTFPSGGQTWVYDTSLEKDPTMAWHQWAWTDANGLLQRHRGMSYATLNGVNCCGDWENGRIYQMDPDYYQDDAGATGAITYIKGFPHMFETRAPGQFIQIKSDNKRIQVHSFMADLDCGHAPQDGSGNPAQIGLRYSLDRGNTFGTTVLRSAGAPGEYLTVPTWQPLGIARDMVFELEHNIAGPAALNGCWVQSQMANE